MVDILVWYKLNHSTETGRLTVRNHVPITGVDSVIALEDTIYKYLVENDAANHRDMHADDVMITSYISFPSKSK